MLERGTKLDDLVGKSNDLSEHILSSLAEQFLNDTVEDVLQAGKEDEFLLHYCLIYGYNWIEFV